jgi:hypothetical protein
VLSSTPLNEDTTPSFSQSPEGKHKYWLWLERKGTDIESVGRMKAQQHQPAGEVTLCDTLRVVTQKLCIQDQMTP